MIVFLSCQAVFYIYWLLIIEEGSKNERLKRTVKILFLQNVYLIKQYEN